MHKHTPGPWVVDEYGDIQANGEDVASIACFYGDETNSANARLMAESPAMFALLQEADRLYSTYGLTATGGIEVGAWINNVRDCIARATGIQP